MSRRVARTGPILVPPRDVCDVPWPAAECVVALLVTELSSVCILWDFPRDRPGRFEAGMQCPSDEKPTPPFVLYVGLQASHPALAPCDSIV